MSASEFIQSSQDAKTETAIEAKRTSRKTNKEKYLKIPFKIIASNQKESSLFLNQITHNDKNATNHKNTKQSTGIHNIVNAITG